MPRLGCPKGTVSWNQLYSEGVAGGKGDEVRWIRGEQQVPQDHTHHGSPAVWPCTEANFSGPRFLICEPSVNNCEDYMKQFIEI